MAELEKIKQLFKAFRDDNEITFYQVAQSIIVEEQAANHHTIANELRQALGVPSGALNKMSLIKKTHVDSSKIEDQIEDLVWIKESSIDESKIVLKGNSAETIASIIQEHQKKATLQKYGYNPKSKLLFYGPPGCGKTFTANFIANQLGLPIATLKLSAMISSFLGGTGSNLQQVFDFIKKRPSVLLIDDQNDIGELKRVVNTFLQMLDEANLAKSILIAATNHQDLLDAALWRRFDDVVFFDYPEKESRDIYIRRLLNGVHVGGNLSNIVEATKGLSFGDIQRVVVDSIKAMILSGKTNLSEKEVEVSIENFKSSMAKIRKSQKHSKRSRFWKSRHYLFINLIQKRGSRKSPILYLFRKRLFREEH